MILTVTVNTALDKVLFINEWTTGTVMRTPHIVTSVGGKGLDSSVVLRHLGVDTVGLCFVAGKSGQELVQLLEKYGIKPEPIWVEGETRIAHVISETLHHRHSHIMAGSLSISADNIRELFDRYKSLVRGASWVICAGSIPSELPGNFYGTLTEIAHKSGVSLLIDSVNNNILDALVFEPDIIKMNWSEFVETFQREAKTLDDLKKQAHIVYREKNLKAMVLTLAEHGILAFTSQGAYHAVAPRQIAVNAAGAGDAVSSALVWRLSLEDKWVDALRWAAATSAAVVLTPGTADCSREDIDRIMPDVKVEEI